jgi:hypothetical protein
MTRKSENKHWVERRGWERSCSSWGEGYSLVIIEVVSGAFVAYVDQRRSDVSIACKHTMYIAAVREIDDSKAFLAGSYIYAFVRQ